MDSLKFLIRAWRVAVVGLAMASHAQAAPPVANAGPDRVVADYNEDLSITVRLDGSASTDADDGIVSWKWSWAGGNEVTGEIAEVSFPVTDTPTTVTLTVTDLLGGVHTDTLSVAGYRKSTALFTDFQKQTYRDIGGGLEGFVAGDLLVIDTGGVEVYRRSGGSWAQEGFPTSGSHHFAVDPNTIVSLNLGFGGGPRVTRFAENAWSADDITFSPPDAILDGFNNQRVIALDSQTVVIADYGSDLSAPDGGAVRVYQWSGNTWVYQTDLTPPGGFVANGSFGRQVEVRQDCIVASGYNPASESNELHVFRNTSGNWNHEITFDGKRSTVDPVGKFNGEFGFANNVLVATRFLPASGTYELAIHEKQLSGWSQRILGTGVGAIPFEHFRVDGDGDAFAGSAFGGVDYLFKRPGADWQIGAIEPQLILTNDNPSLRVSDFSGNLLTLRDGIAGVIRLIDTTTSVFPINVEPVADAGLGIQTTSFDGQAVPVFLNGGASFDLDDDGALDAVWTWDGGSAAGLYAFAEIPPQVTSIELKLADSAGAVSKDTIDVEIVSPPVIEAGIDRVVVDADGDGSVQLKVSGQVLSLDHPIASYSWSWPGGVLSGQSGTINLGAAADGKEVTLTVVDEAGLVSQSSFRFSLLNPQPVPDIVAPANAQNNDLFGYNVGINGTSAMIGAFNKPATYQLENINGIWQQISLSPGSRQGSAVALADDFAFSGAYNESSGVGRVRVLVKSGGVWGLSATLAPPPTQGVSPFNFGLSFARSGDRLVVGGPGSSFSDGGNFYSACGAAFVYRLIGGSWVFEQTLLPSSPETQGRFGSAVAIHDQSIAVGSSTKDGQFGSGAVDVFELGTVWTHVASLENDPGASVIDSFGSSLAMNDTEILAGAPGQGNNGQVYRYKKVGNGIWQPNGAILPSLPSSPNLTFFGSSLSLKGNVLVVGVPGDATGTNRGGVQTFLLRDGTWEHRGNLAITTQLDPPTASNFIQFARENSSISHDGRNLIVGAPQARTSGGVQSGKVYIYRNYAALDPTANYEPLANAGADIQVTDTIVRDPNTNEITEPLGSEAVTLNGTASTDPENAIVSYEWTWQGGSASGVSPSARFPVGTTIVTLTVTDALGVVNSDTLSVAVSLPQTAPASLPAVSGNTLTVGLPSPLAKWRLSSEFLWHGDNESTTGVQVGATYQVEVLPYSGSTEVISTFITIDSPAMSLDLELELPSVPTGAATLSFPETSQGFSWRLVGESAWRNVADDGDELVENVELPVPTGLLRIEFKPVEGFTTPQTRLLNGISNTLTALDWAEYLRINSYNPAKTFDLAATPDLSASPYRYVGMIRSALGRGTGTVVADRVVLTAAHLFFDSNGLQWADTQWYSRQQQGARQAPPIAPRGVLYQTSYAKLIAPDSVEGTVADLPEDPQQVDFAVLFFTEPTTWDQGSANFLQSTPAKNWLTGGENKHAVAYPQRSQEYEHRGKIFQKQFAAPLQSLGTGLYESTEVFGDGGASGSALFVQPAGSPNFYPAAILLAGQGRAVYRVIDGDITRMIKDGEDAATGNDDVLNNDSSLVVFNGLGSLTTIGVQVAPDWLAGSARWSIYPANAAAVTNMPISQRVAFNTKWTGYTIVFSAVSGYYTPASFYAANGNVTRGAANIRSVTYVAIPPPPPPPPLESWIAFYSISDMNSDDDKDGMSALLEYALDRNPGQPDYRPAILVSDNPSQTAYAEFDVFVSSAAAGIIYRVKISDSLDPGDALTLATFTSADGSSTYRKVTDTQLRSASQKRFAWVEIELP